MSEKALDKCGRWRSKTIAFRVSPEENDSITRRAHFAGITKQEYLIRRCMEQDVVVIGSIRVHKALQDQMQAILEELQRIGGQGIPNADLLETICVVAKTVAGMNLPPKEDV